MVTNAKLLDSLRSHCYRWASRGIVKEDDMRKMLAAALMVVGLIVTTAGPAAAYQTETGVKNCVLYGYTTANGQHDLHVKAPGGSYVTEPYSSDFRSVTRTVYRNGSWGASATVLLQSVTYAWCNDGA